MDPELIKSRPEHSLQIEDTDASPSPKSKSSLRMNYEAHAEVIRKQTGDLESVRKTLGLSQRKMAQLLLVDPSAWTRWLKEGSAPPHIYRALQWYMTLQEKIPGLTPSYFLGRDSRVDTAEMRSIESNLIERIKELEEQNSSLKNQVQGTRIGFFMLVISVMILASVFFWVLKRM